MIFAYCGGKLCPVIKKLRNYIFKHNNKCPNARSGVWYHTFKSTLIWANSPFNCKRLPGERLTRYTWIHVELSNDDDDDDYDDDETSRSESLLEVFC